jgi:hypothetical protein
MAATPSSQSQPCAISQRTPASDGST